EVAHSRIKVPPVGGREPPSPKLDQVGCRGLLRNRLPSIPLRACSARVPRSTSRGTVGRSTPALDPPLRGLSRCARRRFEGGVHLAGCFENGAERSFLRTARLEQRRGSRAIRGGMRLRPGPWLEP